MTATVRDFLEGSDAAQCSASLDLGAGRGVAIWQNHDDRVSYKTPRGHVFSLYLQGGTGTRRLDVQRRSGGVNGRPGAVCIMPEGQNSEWEITTKFRFVHLYMPDDSLRASFAEMHDRDARQLDIPERTFAEMPGLIAPLTGLAQAALAGDALMAETALSDVIAGLGARRIQLRGGLPPNVLRRIDDWIDANLEDRIRLEDLARVVGLSPFHLHRMFRVSRGMTLQAWIMRHRIDRARALLAGNAGLIDIAMACGFASQSHFTRAFKAQTAHTPAAYRKALLGR